MGRDESGAEGARALAPAETAAETRSYDLLPVPVTVHASDLHDVIAETCGPAFLGRSFRIFDGGRFAPRPGDVFATRHPFLLLHACGSNAAERYVAVSALDGTAEDVLDEASVPFARERFRRTCAALPAPVTERATRSRAASLSDAGDRILRGLAPARRAVRDLERHLPDLDVSLAPLDHCEIVTGRGLLQPVLAKVRVSRHGLPSRIARVTGQAGERDVIFPLGGMAGRGAAELRLTILHEIAHHLTFEDPRLNETAAHGPAFGTLLAALCRAVPLLSRAEISEHLEVYFDPDMAGTLVRNGEMILEFIRVRGERLTCAAIREYYAGVRDRAAPAT